MHGPVYDFFKDQGSIIAGVLALMAALIAGGVAYWLGKSQVQAMQRQIDQRDAETAEHDRRARLDLLNLFEAVAAQMAMLAEMRQEEAQRRSGTRDTVAPNFAGAFIIPWAEIETPGLTSLVPGEIRVAAMELRAAVHRLNSLIEVKARTVNLPWSELTEALRGVRDRAGDLQRTLKDFGESV